MQRLVALVLVVAGLGLAVYGLQESDSFRSELSEFFTGNPTDRAVWLTLVGVVLLAAGTVAFFLRPRRV